MSFLSNQRQSHQFLLALLLVLLLAGCAPRFEPRDILLITVDTLRADALGAYGNSIARTPNLDSLANRGKVWEHAYTPFPRTTPALASMLTGLGPEGHGSREVAQPIRGDLPSLPQELTALGWTSLAVSANGAAGPHQGLDRGFAEFVSADQLRRPVADHVTQAAVDLLDKHRSAEKVFLWVHYIDPHFPYTPPKRFLEPVGAGPCSEVVRWASQSRSRVGQLVANRDNRASRDLADCRRLYEAEVAYTDEQIGVLLEAWKGVRGSLDQSVIVTTADHGENLGEWDLYFQHGPNVHDASVRIPLIVTAAGLETGRSAQPASLLDLRPTLLRLAGVPKDELPVGEGRDLTLDGRASLKIARAGDRTLFAEGGSALLLESFRYISSGRKTQRHCTNGPKFALCQDPGQPFELYDHVADPDLLVDLIDTQPAAAEAMQTLRRRWPPEVPRQRSVRQGNFLLVEIPTYQGSYRSALYDFSADPELTTDVKSSHGAKTAELQRALDSWTASLPRPEGLGPLTEQQESELRALGYID